MARVSGREGGCGRRTGVMPQTKFESFSNVNVPLSPVNYCQQLLVRVFHYGGTPPPSVKSMTKFVLPIRVPPPPPPPQKKKFSPAP